MSLAVAALAVFFGPLVSRSISKRQLGAHRLDMVAQARQQWIDTVRDATSEILANIDILRERNSESGWSQDEFHDHVANSKEFREILFLVNKVELLLNPAESKPQTLLRDLKEARRFIWKEIGPDNEEDMMKLERSIISTTGSILKEEWERIKQLKT